MSNGAEIFWQTTVFFTISYMCGSILGSQIVGHIFSVDIKKLGSKNPGATNMLRVKGKKAAALNLLIDLTKPWLAFGFILLASMGLDKGIIEIGMIGAIVGHCFPWTSGFKGGKGVATTFGTFFIINWIIALSILVFWLILMKITKISSVSSLLSFWLIGSLIWIPVFWQEPGLSVLYEGFYHSDGFPYVPIVFMISNVLVTARHYKNIHNIFNGNEKATKITNNGLPTDELNEVKSNHDNAEIKLSKKT